MTPQDWRDIARVLRAGAFATSAWEALARMAAECEKIAAGHERPSVPQISCADCLQLKPGPGVLHHRGSKHAFRICDDCAKVRQRRENASTATMHRLREPVMVWNPR